MTLLSLGVAAGTARAATPPAGFSEKVLVPSSAVSSPTAIAYEPGSGAVYVLEQGSGGSARVLRRDPSSGAVAPALTIPCVDSAGERGLLGIAFDPSYTDPSDANRFVYLYYTRIVGGTGSACAVPGKAAGSYNRVVRYREGGRLLTGEELLLDGPALGPTNHNGGTLRFLPDGTLMISMGDNNSDDLPVPYARDLSDLRGKMLRIARNGSVPADNPFVGQAGVRPEIWAWGLRNPFRFSVDPATGTPFIADVGENTWEEIDRGIAGADYGYPCFEGPAPFRACDPPPAPGTVTDPIYAYGHGSQTLPVQGGAVTGGPVYRAASFPPEYRGNYFFGDYVDGWIRRGTIGTGGTLSAVQVFLPDAAGVVDMAVSPAGCLAWVSITGAGVREVCYGAGDQDGDGVPDGEDVCPAVFDPRQDDFDRDGIGDRCESGASLADADRSGRVDGFDLARLGRAFGASCGDPLYDATVDFDRDCGVDGDDLATLARSFGLTVP